MSSPSRLLARACGLALLAGALGLADRRLAGPSVPAGPWDATPLPLPVTQGFEENAAPRRPLTLSRESPHEGQRAARFEARGFFTEQASLAFVDLRGTEDARVRFAWRLPRFASGRIVVSVTLFGPTEIRHPAVPRLPRRISRRAILRVERAAPDWSTFEARLSDVFSSSLLSAAAAARLELRWEGDADRGVRPDGAFEIDAVSWRAGAADA